MLRKGETDYAVYVRFHGKGEHENVQQIQFRRRRDRAIPAAPFQRQGIEDET